MTTVKNTTATGPSAALLNAVNPQTAATDSVQADQDKFMTLLVTQLKNQDPLNPMDNAQMTSQLAQLNTVTGINKLNATLTAMQADQASTNSMSAISMINHGVLVPGNALTLTEGKSLFGVEVGSHADKLQIDIRNSSGKVVQSFSMDNVDAGTLPLSWDGKTADGKTSPDGAYTIKVTATSGTDTLKDAQALTFGTVASVSTGAAGVKLNIPGIGQLGMADVKQVL